MCHQLCLNCCSAAGVEVTLPETGDMTEDHHRKAVERYIADSSDSVKRVFELALRQKKKAKWDNCRVIVEALSEFPAEGTTHNDVYSKVREHFPDYPSGNVTTFLKQLCTADRGEIIRFSRDSNLFSFSNPLYRTYAGLLRQMPKQKERQPSLFDRTKDFEMLTTQLLKLVRAGDSLKITFHSDATGKSENEEGKESLDAGE